MGSIRDPRRFCKLEGKCPIIWGWRHGRVGDTDTFRF